MIHKKSGSVTVFIMIFFVTLVGMIFTFISVSKDIAVKNSTKALGSLWANSILAEFDLNLQGRYNLFAYYGLTGDVEKKMNFYAQHSFNGKKYIDYNGCSCNLYDYSMGNTNVIKKQVVEVGKLSIAENIIKPNKEIKSIKGLSDQPIKTEKLFSDLPSKGTSNSISISGISKLLQGTKSINNIIKKGTDQFFENQYIFTYFKDVSNDRGLGKTYFDNEIEYIIAGNKIDSKNKNSVKLKIIGVREIINFLYIIKNPKMEAETLAAAELITPGPAAQVTQKVLQGAWALAESENDYNLLINGKKVPTMKDEKSWAIDLESIVNNKTNEYVDPNNVKGETYKNYLSLFVYTMDERVRLLRLMDLIQINMRYYYYRSFKLKDYNGGLDLAINVNGDSYEIKKEY